MYMVPVRGSLCHHWHWTPLGDPAGPRPSNDWLGITSAADKSALSATKVERQGSIKENRCVSEAGTDRRGWRDPLKPWRPSNSARRAVSLLGEIIFEWDPVPPAPWSCCPPKWPPMKWIDAWRPSHVWLCLANTRWWSIGDHFARYRSPMVSAWLPEVFTLTQWKDYYCYQRSTMLADSFWQNEDGSMKPI